MKDGAALYIYVYGYVEALAQTSDFFAIMKNKRLELERRGRRKSNLRRRSLGWAGWLVHFDGWLGLDPLGGKEEKDMREGVKGCFVFVGEKM